MKTLLISKRKTVELAVLLFLDIVFYFLWGSLSFVILFTLGFIWNWVASQDVSSLLENKRYRFSTLKTVINLQNLILKPLGRAPEFIKFFARILPAGIFWWAVIYFNEADMPWWAVFIGSFVAELVQIENKLFKSDEEPTL